MWKIKDFKLKKKASPKQSQSYCGIFYTVAFFSAVFFLMGIFCAGAGEQECLIETSKESTLKKCREEYYALHCDRDEHKSSLKCLKIEECLEDPETYEQDLRKNEMMNYFGKYQKDCEELIAGAFVLILLIFAKIKNCL